MTPRRAEATRPGEPSAGMEPLRAFTLGLLQAGCAAVAEAVAPCRSPGRHCCDHPPALLRTRVTSTKLPQRPGWTTQGPVEPHPPGATARHGQQLKSATAAISAGQFKITKHRGWD